MASVTNGLGYDLSIMSGTISSSLDPQFRCFKQNTTTMVDVSRDNLGCKFFCNYGSLAQDGKLSDSLFRVDIIKLNQNN